MFGQRNLLSFNMIPIQTNLFSMSFVLIFLKSMHLAVSPSRQPKQTTRTQSYDETLANIDDDKRKQRLKQKNDFDNNNNKLPRRFKGTNTWNKSLFRTFFFFSS